MYISTRGANMETVNQPTTVFINGIEIGHLRSAAGNINRVQSYESIGGTHYAKEPLEFNLEVKTFTPISFDDFFTDPVSIKITNFPHTTQDVIVTGYINVNISYNIEVTYNINIMNAKIEYITNEPLPTENYAFDPSKL